MVDALRAIDLFRDLGDDALAALAARMEARDLAAGEVLFREGDVGDTVFIVRSGALEVRKEAKTLAVLHAGETLGEMAFFEDESRSADAVALGPTALLAIRNEACRAFLREHPEPGARILFGMLQAMSRRLRQTSAYLTTVYETGRVVGRGLGVEAMGSRILERLLADVDGASGGVLLLHNPYAEAYEAAAEVGAAVDLDGAVGLATRHLDDEVFQDRFEGAVLGAPLRRDDGEALGCLLLRKDGDEPFSTQQEIVLAAVAAQTGLGILEAWARQDEVDRERLHRGRAPGL